jgi:hypothetical protein
LKPLSISPLAELGDQLKTEIVKAVRAATPEAWIIEEEDDAGIVGFILRIGCQARMNARSSGYLLTKSQM